MQEAVDREPTCRALVEFDGEGTVEAWTTPFNRDGQPEKAFLTVRTSDDSRALAVIDEPEAAAVTVREDIAGAVVRVHADGRASLA